METSLRIITTTIILLWSIQTYKCTEGFKPGMRWLWALCYKKKTFNLWPYHFLLLFCKKIFFISLPNPSFSSSLIWNPWIFCWKISNHSESQSSLNKKIRNKIRNFLWNCRASSNVILFMTCRLTWLKSYCRQNFSQAFWMLHYEHWMNPIPNLFNILKVHIQIFKNISKIKRELRRKDEEKYSRIPVENAERKSLTGKWCRDWTR